MTKNKPVDFVAYIALSAQGYPAPALGYSFSRRQLMAQYLERCQHNMLTAGYRPIKVRICAVKQA